MHGVPKDEIEKEEIDLTGDNRQPPYHTSVSPKGKMNKRKKGEVAAHASEQAVWELEQLVKRQYEKIKRERGTLEHVAQQGGMWKQPLKKYSNGSVQLKKQNTGNQSRMPTSTTIKPAGSDWPSSGNWNTRWTTSNPPG